ncbi:FtsH protease activity modulator HflK [Leucothrix pacifica]|uniref:Protein HflK n=1 Tax=Leucothrix pacifica TaxID=1247513 RepID=A0A317CRV3_9GAMM|nr:FtsH protease activity modulator HflK [Leucothrix pacifica]PWQ99042.1 FtsH protease activity modulator HflK [Leucothrix pacifica]
MPWNEPGGNKDKDPWSNNKPSRGSSSDGIEDAIQKMNEKLGQLFGGRSSGGNGNGEQPSGQGPSLNKNVVIGIAAVAFLGWLTTGFYTVDSAERGVELRFGKYQRTTMPGLRWKLPYPIETLEKVDVDRSRTAKDARSVTHMLTKDENIISIAVNVQYNIKNPEDYLFNVELPDFEPDQRIATVYNVMRSAVREVVGRETMDSIIGADREKIAPEILQIMQRVLDDYESGVDVIKVNVTKAEAPDEVKDAFDDAIQAREDQNRYKNQAETYAKKVVPVARGKAARTIESATAYRSRLTSKAQGEASRFEQLATAYAKAPEVTRERLYLETMEEVLQRSSKVLIDSDSGNNMMYLPLDKLSGGTGASSADQGAVAAAVSAFDTMNNSTTKSTASSSVSSVRDATREGR